MILVDEKVPADSARSDCGDEKNQTSALPVPIIPKLPRGC